MKEGLEAHDAEVTMAVRLPSPFGDEDSEGDEDKDSDADSDAISDWFSNHGFEFVDVDPPVKLVVVSNEEEDELDPYDITGIPRIIGALSTIIWPSMIRKERKPFVPTRRSLSSQLATPVAVTRDSSVFPDDLDPQQEESHADHMSSTRSLFASPEGAVTMGDLDILESWLEGDELDPWKGRGVAVSASTPAAAPRSDDVVKDSSTTPHASEHSAGIGFEDDFTDFISAPQPVPKVDIVKGEGVTHAWERHPQGGEDEDDDVSLPSQEEIKITAQRIFGRRAFANQSSTSGSSNPHDPASVKGEDEEPFRFDLTEVLGALQSMKEEVGEIKDPAERRKAAARIALGFMEGLGVDDMKEEDLFDK
ncbi:hypothetical protein FRC02_008666 [Tulasnella sp. 418]|nr:hypothetical protein FRC02_008666 [Tulasnella sp. 418]